MEKRRWAILLIVFGLMYWFFPGWNGFFFESSDISMGEGRIMASILLIGGVLLYYLPSSHKEG